MRPSQRVTLRCVVAAIVAVVLHAQAAVTTDRANKLQDSFFDDTNLQAGHDPWEVYNIISEGDAIESWEMLRKVKLNYYSLTYETIKGRRRLGVLPSDVDKLMPEAIFRANIPFIRPDGSVTRMENVPNIDWSNLFSHTLAVTQELSRRYSQLEEELRSMETKRHYVRARLTRLEEALGDAWQSSARLRDIADIAELKCNILKSKIMFEEVAGEEHRRLLGLRHKKNLEAMDMELDKAHMLLEEKASLAAQTLLEEEIGLKKLEIAEENMRRSTERALLQLDVEAANQTTRLQANRRLAESLATIHETAAAERGAEGARTAIIRARGEAARNQVQAVIDETVALVATIITSAASNPCKLAKTLAALFCVVFVSLSVGNFSTLAARAISRRLTKPQLVREADLPNSLPAIAVDWIWQSTRALIPPRLGRARQEPLPLKALEGVILPPDLEHRLSSLASSIRASCARGSPLPHVLLHGAPGSGKSLIARQLVKACGLKKVIIAGGDVGPLRAVASSELSSIFRWIAGAGGRKKRGAGVALIMDEAEAALGDRRKIGMSEHARSALTTILLHSGEARPGFMMVLTSSRPQDLDEAMLDRVDEVIHLPAPKLTERKKLARQYFSIYLHHNVPEEECIEGTHGNNERAGGLVRLSEDFVPKMAGLVKMLAVKSEGFYGRDMVRFFSAVQAAAYSSEDCALTLDMWAAIERHKCKELSERTSLATTPHTLDTSCGATESTRNLDDPENDVSSVAPDMGADAADPEIRVERHDMLCDPEGTHPRTIGLSFCGRKISHCIPIPRGKPTLVGEIEGRWLRYTRLTSNRVLLRANAHILLDKTNRGGQRARGVKALTADACGATGNTSDLDNRENDVTAVTQDAVGADTEIRGGRHDTTSDAKKASPETILVGISFRGRKIARRIALQKEERNPQEKQGSSIRYAWWTSKRMLLRAKARILLEKTRSSRKCAPEVGKSRLCGLLRHLSRSQGT